VSAALKTSDDLRDTYRGKKEHELAQDASASRQGSQRMGCEAVAGVAMGADNECVDVRVKQFQNNKLCGSQ
jgi:hypothetical protein